MSHTILSQAVLARVHEFGGELAELDSLIDHVQNGTGNDLIHDTLEAVRIQLGRFTAGLSPRLGEECGAYALPLGLRQLAAFARQAVPLVLAVAECYDEHAKLTLQFAGYRLERHGNTATHIAATVVEELPPLQRETTAIPAHA